MEFAKFHGLGNDFIICRAFSQDEHPGSLSAIAIRLCERHRGVGADGVVFYQPTQGDHDADFSALIFNADGSRAEMSGNGIRCLAAHLMHSDEHRGEAVKIRTVSGIKKLILRSREKDLYRLECSMGHPILEPKRIPARVETGDEAVIHTPIETASGRIHVTLSSMGNPHCSTFWPDVAKAPLETLGPVLERDSRFPNRANVEFIQVLDRSRIRVRFWERGVGPTLSSGTGSSAAAVASILRKLVDSPVTVESELGALLVDWQPGRELVLTGPAEFVCCGRYKSEGACC